MFQVPEVIVNVALVQLPDCLTGPTKTVAAWVVVVTDEALVLPGCPAVSAVDPADPGEVPIFEELPEDDGACFDPNDPDAVVLFEPEATGADAAAGGGAL